MTPGHRAAWLDAVADGRPPAPTVLVLGGFITSPPVYRHFVRRLRERGAVDVVVSEVWTADWLLLARRGFGPILTRSARALLEASARSRAASLGAPVLVVGHSTGGLIARMLTSPVPYAGRTLNGSGRVGAIVTLGTPHHMPVRAGAWNETGARASAFLDAEIPGPWFAPRVGYLSVSSRLAAGRRAGSARERGLWRRYAGLVPEPVEDVIEGDRLVPVPCALLRGAPSLVLDDAAHGQWPGRDWYGSDRFLDRWWPLAIDAWKTALIARAGG